MRNSDLFVFLGGALAGAGMALLLSSDKGREWTRKAGEFAKDEADKIYRGAKDLLDLEEDRIDTRKVKKFVKNIVE